ncbi:hypothetical protein U1Q18_051854 [Sarracenia purpurea var. burkii]
MVAERGSSGFPIYLFNFVRCTVASVQIKSIKLQLHSVNQFQVRFCLFSVWFTRKYRRRCVRSRVVSADTGLPAFLAAFPEMALVVPSPMMEMSVNAQDAPILTPECTPLPETSRGGVLERKEAYVEEISFLSGVELLEA